MSFGFGLSFTRARTTTLDQQIAALFADGTPGAWYDPSDFTTLYQDSAGTTPVTALEQPVGLMLDKSKGLVLGSDLLNGTGNPFLNVSDWPITVGGGSRALNGTALTVTYAVSSTVAGRTFVVPSASFVVITYTLSNITAGTARILVSNSPGDAARRIGTSRSAAGTYTEIVSLPAGTFYLELNKSDAGSADFSVVSNKVIPGAHAYHTPGDTTTRPTVSRRINLLTKTEDFSDSVWLYLLESGTSAPTVTTNSTTAPDGTLTADTLNGLSNTLRARRQIINGLTVGKSYTATCWFKSAASGSATAARLTVNNTTAWDTGGSNKIALSSSWQMATVTWTQTGGTSAYLMVTVWDQSGNVDADCYGNVVAWGASLVPADLSGLPYQRVNTTTDYDTSSVFPTFLRCDGVNDSLQTNAIDFTATDKMFVGAAVRKLSDAALSAVMELNADPGNAAITGVFVLSAPGGTPASDRYVFGSKGTTFGFANTGDAAYTAPHTAVVSGAGNISGDSAILRVNGTQVGSSTSDQGTGNFGNHKMYLFARGGTSRPFNGWFYGSVIAGKTLTAAQISTVERYMAGKTKTVSLA